MIVAVSFGLKNILVNSQTVSIIEIPKLINQLIHHFIVVELFVVDEFGFLLNNVIKSKTERKTKLRVNLWLDGLRCLSVQKFVNFFGLGQLIIRVDFAFLYSYISYKFLHIDMLKMSIQSSSSCSFVHHILSCNTLFEVSHALILSHFFIGFITLALDQTWMLIRRRRSDRICHVWDPIVTTLVLVLKFVCHPLRPIHELILGDLSPRKCSGGAGEVELLLI